MERATLAGVWGRTPERTCAYADRFSVANAATTLDALPTSNIDAVYVATHPNSHAELCLPLLRPGSMCSARSRPALNVRQLETILAAAREQDRLFMEAMKPPFFPLYRRLKEHLECDPSVRLGSSARDTATRLSDPTIHCTFANSAGAASWALVPTKHFSLSIGSDFEAGARQWAVSVQRAWTILRFSNRNMSEAWPSFMPGWIC